jgi:TonB-linked SusC/RagA family outer membrane protein
MDRLLLLPLTALLFLFTTTSLQAQTKVINGRVLDDKGRALQGVSVNLKGTTKGTATDEKGTFTIETGNNAGTLVFSFIGYASQEIDLKNQSNIIVTLHEDISTLGDVVVVGYGTQKKVNLTGAVDQVGPEVLENRPLPNLTRGLQGVIPNLNIRMTDGKPTRSADYNVRGATSIGAGGSALILIDGVPGDPNTVNPNDVENISVLKDASSAAIYGARGSFGVILITTKKAAKDKSQINYSASYSLNKRTIIPKMVTNGYQWAKTFDSAYYSWYDYNQHPAKANSVFPFSLEYLDEFQRRDQDPSLPKVDINPTTGEYVYYGNTDWLHELYADNDPSTEHSLSISGSGKKTDYYVSGRYMWQKGVFRYSPDNYRNYNIRAKGSVDVFDWLKVENDMSYVQTSYFFPILNHPSNTPVWRRISDEAFPMAMLKNPDGTLTQNASIVFGSFISGNNYSKLNTQQLRNTSRFTASFLHNKLHVNGDLTISRLTSIEDRLYTPVPYSKKPGEMLERGENKMNQQNDRTNYLGANIYGDYAERFGRHSFKILLGYNYENSLLKSLFI